MHCSLVSVIMAGGLGKRMSSIVAKVLHEINSKPMLVDTTLIKFTNKNIEDVLYFYS